MKLRYTIAITFLLSSAYCCLSQVAIGPSLSIYFESKKGSALCDSIQVDVDDSRGGRVAPGFFIQFAGSGKLTYRAEINYFKNLFGPIVYNKEDQCAFCPVKKAVTISSASLDIPISVAYRVINKPLKVQIIIGLNTVLNFKQNNIDIDFNGKHQGVAAIINKLDETIKPVVFFYSVGAKFDIRRFSLHLRSLRQLSNSFTNDISLANKLYPFKTNAVYLNMGLTYHFSISKK